jgi:hypothetical protein
MWRNRTIAVDDCGLKSFESLIPGRSIYTAALSIEAESACPRKRDRSGW